MFVALPKTDEARVVGKQGLRWGTSVGANCCSRYRSRFKVEFISKIGDGLKELDETVYWLELLTGSRIVSSPKQTSLQDETNQPLVILTMLGAFDLLERWLLSCPFVIPFGGRVGGGGYRAQ